MQLCNRSGVDVRQVVCIVNRRGLVLLLLCVLRYTANVARTQISSDQDRNKRDLTYNN